MYYNSILSLPKLWCYNLLLFLELYISIYVTYSHLIHAWFAFFISFLFTLQFNLFIISSSISIILTTIHVWRFLWLTFWLTIVPVDTFLIAFTNPTPSHIRKLYYSPLIFTRCFSNKLPSKFLVKKMTSLSSSLIHITFKIPCSLI